MIFDTALDGWVNLCRRPLCCLHQSASYFDGLCGEGFPWPAYKMLDWFPPLRFPSSSNKGHALLHYSETTRFTARFEPEPVWSSIAPPNPRLTVECICSVLLRHPHWVTWIGSPTILHSAVVMAPIESPRFPHFNVDFVSHSSFVNWADFSARHEY